MDSICSWSVNDLIYEMDLIRNNFQQNLQYKFAYVCYIAFKMVPPVEHEIEFKRDEAFEMWLLAQFHALLALIFCSKGKSKLTFSQCLHLKICKIIFWPQ